MANEFCLRWNNYKNNSLITILKINACKNYCTKDEVFIKDFFSQCDQIPHFSADWVSFTEEILNEKLHFLCSQHLHEHCSRAGHGNFLSHISRTFIKKTDPSDP